MYDLRPSGHTDPVGLIDPTLITNSHQRCTGFGLGEADIPDFGRISKLELAERLEINRALYSHALPVMESLYEQISNTHNMVILTDLDGMILHALGDDDFLEKADRVALSAGVSWSERHKGTNAVGTALHERRPVVVNGPEHYLRANHFLTCSCAPILDPHGQVIGALDVSGDHRGFHRHTLALVNMSAQMIGNQLFAEAFPEGVRIHFHSRAEFIGTIVEGIVAFTTAGRLLSANRSAQFQLGLSIKALQAHTFSSLFGLPMSSLLEHYRSANPGLLSLSLGNGVTVRARAEFRTPSFVFASMGWANSMAAAASAPNDVTMGAGESAAPEPREEARGKDEVRLASLACLDTGDRQVGQAIQMVSKVKGKDIPILILGETGTGKELLAKAIHNDSQRNQAHFVAVNCASIPENLIESELFGYQEGAFTGARKKGGVGKIVQANGGTLFLDEIGDMPLSLQARLLRVLQDRIVTPLGSAKSISVDIAVVCATNRNLREMIARGEFRDDLYYRLSGLLVRLPALRMRTDLPVLLRKILAAESAAAGAEYTMDAEVLSLFHRYSWPGNIRQLANVLRTACVMADDDGVIRACHLPEELLDEMHAASTGVEPAWRGPVPVGIDGASPQIPVVVDKPQAASEMKLEDLQIAAMAAALEQHNGNLSSAARALGVSRNTLYRKLEHLQPSRKRRG
ncbi:MAG TPA: sigma-54-dependent Fis family transcriptional regulator [Burkholderiaceae bacterium]